MSNNPPPSESHSAKDDKRADLRQRLVAAAEAQIAANGLAGLKAREVTTAAGCALGALYNAFDDLDRLVLQVNSGTLARLGAVLTAAVPQGAQPEAAMQALAAAYVEFALTHRNLWQALFDHRLPPGTEVPDWHRQDHAVLIAQIIGPLAELRPDLPPEALPLRARTIFAAVHGVVQLALQGRFVGVPAESLRAEVAALVEAMARGARLVRQG